MRVPCSIVPLNLLCITKAHALFTQTATIETNNDDAVFNCLLHAKAKTTTRVLYIVRGRGRSDVYPVQLDYFYITKFIVCLYLNA